MSNLPKENPQDEIMTSPGEATYLDPFEEAHITATHTLVVENRTTLKVRKCRLLVSAGPDSGKELISDKERIRIGAHSSNDLVLAEDRTASRHHFEVQYTERGYLLVDLNSTNGTFLNADNQVKGESRVNDGDIISFGEVHFWYLLTETLHAKLSKV